MTAAKGAAKGARKTARKPPVDQLDNVRVKLTTALAETAIEVDCTIGNVEAVAMRLHDILQRLVERRPELGHVIAEVAGGAIHVPSVEEYEEGRQKRPAKHLGF